MNYVISIYFLLQLTHHVKGQDDKGYLPIAVKDFGVVELKKNDVAMIFYITVTNTGHELVHLFVNATKCCQIITKTDEDCESIKLIGGDMGQLFPQDSRNLTLLYANLYPHNRVGSCDMLIYDTKGGSIKQAVPFNTTIVTGSKVHVPRLLEQYYELTDAISCKNADEDPLNTCKPYICDIRYDGTRSLYNYTTEKCEKIPACVTDPQKPDEQVAYDVDTGVCRSIISTMTESDFAEFKEGRPSAQTLQHEHGYPINVRCHNGKKDEKGHWCKCNEGWTSAAMDHKLFNPDIQVYHMCTVWEGSMEAEEARNITVMPKSMHKTMNIFIFSILGASFLMLLPVLIYLLYRLKLCRKFGKADVLDQSEMAILTKHTDESE